MKTFSLKYIYLISALTHCLGAFSQQEYFSLENKKQGVDFYKTEIYRGCSDLKSKQDPVSMKEMNSLVLETQKIVEENFKKAFEENPKIKLAFQNDLKTIARDPGCQLIGNNCRAKLLSLAIYYYRQFRPDLPDCEDKNDLRCVLEDKYRKASLQGTRNNYGQMGPGTYKKELIAQKNNTTIKLFNIIMHKDKTNLHICNEVKSDLVYQYSLNLQHEGKYLEGMDPDHNPNIEVVKTCVDEKKTLFAEFISTEIDSTRTTVGQDQVEPVKSKIENFLKSNADMIVTDVIVTASSANIPFYTTVAGKKTVDPQSENKNLTLATERSFFVAKALTSIKSSSSQRSHINMSVKAQVAGPEFEMMNLNDRFVTKMTPGYLERISAVFKKHSKTFKEDALVSSPEDLLDEKKFSNLYQARFKPFEGFKIHIQGYIKSEMKCLDKSSPASSKSKSSRQ